MLGKIGQIMQNFSGLMKKEEAETDASAASLDHDGAELGDSVAWEIKPPTPPTPPTPPSFGEKEKQTQQNADKAKARMGDIENGDTEGIKGTKNKMQKAQDRIDEIEKQLNGKDGNPNEQADAEIETPELAEGGIADASAGSFAHDIAQIGESLSAITKQFGENISDASIVHSDQSIATEVGALGMTGDKRIYTDENFDSTSAVEMVHMVQNAPQISVEEALAALEHARGQVGIDPDLQDILNHPDAQAMLENLKENGINSFDMHGTDLDGQGSDEQILEILESGRKATIEHGLEMPQSEQDVSQEVSLTELEYEHDHANDDYGVA